MQSINMPPPPPWIDAREATALLGVRAQSLYASVSRGRVRSKRDASDPRRRLYLREDVLRLAVRRSGAATAHEVAARTVAWGEPILDSALSTIADGQLWYAGRSALALAREGGTLEQVAALLWRSAPPRFDAAAARALSPAGTGLGTALGQLAAEAAAGRPSRGRPVEELQREAALLIASVAQAWIGSGTPHDQQQPLHERIACRWHRPAARSAIRQALVLLADHELNASTFAARVAISTGAPLAAGLLAALATLTGPLHGGAATALRALLAEAHEGGAVAAVRARLGQGLALPAFGHPLYPDGDPRAVQLLGACALPAPFTELADAVLEISGAHPNVDFALAALADAHGLPPEAPLALFSIARSVGWIAHALEQRRDGRLIRPRASYAGP